MNCVIVDYGMGNLRSIQHKLRRIDVEAVVTADPKEIEQADLLFLPGVGHFAKGMQNLNELGLIPVLNRKVLEEKTPIMGICLGMQLLSKFSEEGNVEGLGWIDAKTIRFRFDDKEAQRKIPHIGWNYIQPARQSPLLDGIAPDQRFYFVHSYHLSCGDPSDVLTTTNYGYDFASSVHRENVFGTQFHPEKSHRRGMQLVKNFIEHSAALV
jgi:glutamine amidotransferase